MSEPMNGHRREAVDRSAPAGGATQTRRKFLLWTIRASYGAFALAFALPALALRTLTRESETVAAGDTLVYAADDQAGLPVNANDLDPGTAIQAFPAEKTEDANNLIEIVRLSEDPSDIVAYSAICTHLGCSVLPRLEEGLIPCPCHASYFDPANEGQVVSGPAERPLPSLPVDVEQDGTIVTAGTFTGDVGPA